MPWINGIALFAALASAALLNRESGEEAHLLRLAATSRPGPGLPSVYFQPDGGE